MGIGFAAIVVIIVGLVVITRSGNSTPTSGVNHTGTPGSGSGKASAKKQVFSPASVTVAVLNGTAVNGLAADIGAALSGDGYRKGNITNAATQTQLSTVVYYMPKYKSAAEHVAKALRISTTDIAPANPAVIQSCATTPSATTTSCSGDLIVSAGQNLASMANGSGAG